MRLTPYIVIALTVFLALTIGAAAQETSNESPRPIEIDLYYRLDNWMLAPAVADGPSTEGYEGTKSIYMAVLRFVDPRTGFPYDKSDPSPGFDLDDLVHSFRLEKKDFVLGEPILVEHRIELNGPGELQWFVGGNYRSRGRDDNFNFVLQGANGAIVPDVYPRLTGFVFGGGFGGDHTIKKDEPLSYWLGLQRYSAITEAGVYDLYCMTGGKQMMLGRTDALKAALPEDVALDHYVDDSGVLIDRNTGLESKRYAVVLHEHLLASGKESPLANMIPDDVLRFVGGQGASFSFAEPVSFGTMAHFRITIRKGTPEEQKEMTARWTKAVQSDSGIAVMGSYRTALLDSLWYCKQNSFLPLLEQWIARTGNADPWFSSLPLHLDALAMRSDSAAFSLLLKNTPKHVTSAFFNLDQSRIPDAIPLCITWLTHPVAEVRAISEAHLVKWTGQSFEHTWKGYHYERPTPEEGKRMQVLWSVWWEKNKKGFKPHAPCDQPCEKRDKATK